MLSDVPRVFVQSSLCTKYFSQQVLEKGVPILNSCRWRREWPIVSSSLKSASINFQKSRTQRHDFIQIHDQNKQYSCMIFFNI